MKYKSHLITGLCVAAVAFCGTANAADKKTASPAPKTAATETDAAEAPAKKPRPVPFYGNLTSMDKSAKSFTIGKTKSRTIMVVDTTKVTKAGSPATFDDLTDNEYVTGSYMKKEDGTLEAKSLKIGGKTDAEKAAAAAAKEKKAAKKAAAEEKADEESAPEEDASPAPKKK